VKNNVKDCIYDIILSCLQIQAFKCIFFVTFCLDETKGILILEFFSNLYSCIIDKHTKFQIIWKKRYLNFIVLLTKKKIFAKNNYFMTWFVNIPFKLHNKLYQVLLCLCGIICTINCWNTWTKLATPNSKAYEINIENFSCNKCKIWMYLILIGFIEDFNINPIRKLCKFQ
jgi:hypothetical protein